jgi:Family of unknown function (DUF6152)
MLRRILLAAVFAGAYTQAWAHHGISNWDLNKDLSITGTLVRIDLINPHAWIFVDVKGADGKVAHWRCEMRSVNSLRRSGWTTDMFKIGSTLTITGSPERHKADYCYLGTIVFADGSHMDRYGQRQLSVAAAKQAPAAHAMRTADGLPNLAGEWAAEQRVMSDPRGQSGTLVPLGDAAKMKPGDLPAGQKAFPGARGSPESLAADPVKAAWERPIPVKLTETGQKASRNFNPASRENPRLRCEPTNILFDWTFDSVVNRVVQTPTRISMQYGHMDLARVIHLDQKSVPAGVKPSLAGYSMGHWDADTLVVETSAFLPGVLNADGRLLHGAKLNVTERFHVESNPVRLTRQFVAEDPEYLTEPWRGADVVFPADVTYAPYRCKDPGGAPAK